VGKVWFGGVGWEVGPGGGVKCGGRAGVVWGGGWWFGCVGWVGGGVVGGVRWGGGVKGNKCTRRLK